MSWIAHHPIENDRPTSLAKGAGNNQLIIPQRLKGSGNQLFREMLLAYNASPQNKSKNPSTGLTAIDYLANPIPAAFPKKSVHTWVFHPPQKGYCAITKSPSPSLRKNPDPCAVSSRQKSNTMTGQQRADTLASEGEKRGLSEKQIIELSVNKAAAKYNLPSKLIKAVIRAESNFNSQAVSSAGAQGLMQLMPATAEELGVKDSFDIDQNVDGGTRYLRKMIDKFGGDIKLALAAYNAGPGTVDRYQGNVPYRQTKQFVNRVLRFSEQIS